MHERRVKEKQSEFRKIAVERKKQDQGSKSADRQTDRQRDVECVEYR